MHIPIIVRSLGHDLYRLGLKPNHKFRPGVELLIYIDGNLSTYGVNDPNLLVQQFYLPWWTGSDRPNKPSSYLSFLTLPDALAEHQRHLTNPDAIGASQRPVDLSAELSKPAYSWHPEVHADVDIPCTRCRLYRAVSLGVADKLRDVENMVHGMEVANGGEKDIGMRRASGFYELYENVLKKEVELEQTAGPGLGSGSGDANSQNLFACKKGTGKGKSKTSKIAESVRAEADDLWRKSAAGNSGIGRGGSQWTWGVDLNSQDIWNMIRGADRQYQLPHSGYDNSLATGRLRTSSPIPSPNDIPDVDDPATMYDQLSHDFPYIRHLRPNEVPIAFSFPTLHYMAAGESDCGPEAPPTSGSDYVYKSDEEKGKRKERKRAMQDEVNSPDQPSTSDSASIIPKGRPPHRPWLGAPPRGYIQPPTLNPSIIRASEVTQGFAIGFQSLPNDAGQNAEYESEPELNRLPSEVDQTDLSDSGSDSDDNMDVVADESDEEIPVGHLGLDNVELGEDGPVGTYGLVGPMSPDDSDDSEIIPVGNLGLLGANLDNDSNEAIEVGNLGLDSVDLVWPNLAYNADDTRARARIRLPRVNPTTGQYTADSFAHIPNEWLE